MLIENCVLWHFWPNWCLNHFLSRRRVGFLSPLGELASSHQASVTLGNHLPFSCKIMQMGKERGIDCKVLEEQMDRSL